MNTVVHLRAGTTGDLLVYISLLREAYLLPHTTVCSFINSPDHVHWRRISTLHGLAVLRWGGEQFAFELANIRDVVRGSDAPPGTKGLRVVHRDGGELFYAPLDLRPEQVDEIRHIHPRLLDVVTPRIAGFQKSKRFALADYVPTRVLQVDFDRPEQNAMLPMPIRTVVRQALDRAATNEANGDYAL